MIEILSTCPSGKNFPISKIFHSTVHCDTVQQQQPDCGCVQETPAIEHLLTCGQNHCPAVTTLENEITRLLSRKPFFYKT